MNKKIRYSDIMLTILTWRTVLSFIIVIEEIKLIVIVGTGLL